MTDVGLPIDPALIRFGDDHRETAFVTSRELLTERDRPRAVFAADDLTAPSTT